MLLPLVGCAESAGSFSIEFRWQTTPPEPGTVVIVASVSAPDGRITPAAPVSYAPGVEVPFDGVPNGAGLVVSVRVYPEGANTSGPPQYFGRSRPFDLMPGNSIIVPVDIDLAEAPGGPGTATTPEVVIANANVANRVGSPQLRLRVRGQGAEAVEVAQNSLFTVALETFTAEQTRVGSSTGAVDTFAIDYDLNADINCESLQCEGLRTVFVRLRQGDLVSDIADVTTTVDTEAPTIGSVSISYTPITGNPLPIPSAGTDTTTISVFLEASESLDFAATATEFVATNGDDELVFRRVRTPSPVSLLFEARPSASLASGAYTPRIRIVDLAGNEADATFDTPPIVVDVARPTLVVNQSAVSYVRAPIGNASPEPLAGGFVIPAGPAYYALAPADPLTGDLTLPASTFMLDDGEVPTQIRVYAEAGQANLLDIAEPDASGAWPRADLQLANVNAPAVYVTGIDAAGNESLPVRIENAWYIASSGLPGAGGDPHATTWSRDPDTPLGFEQNAVSDAERPSLTSPDGDAATAVGDFAWAERGRGVPGRHGAALTYDNLRGIAVLFGGSSSAQNLDSDFVPLSDTWLWDGSSWRNVSGGTTPQARSYAAVAYATRRDRVVLFGGRLSPFAEAVDTWEWDGLRWRNVTPSGATPPGRYEHGMVYDPIRDRVVLFGGRRTFGSTDTLGDTWEWDGREWVERTPASGSPPDGVYDLVFDIGLGQVVAISELDAGVWAWDGTRWTATPVRTERQRRGAGVAYDVERDVTIAFGGLDTLGDEFSETWQWNGTQWTVRFQLFPPPAPRSFHAMTYDDARSQILLVGGSQGVPVLNLTPLPGQTWGWDGGRWSTLANDEGRPSARSGSGVVYTAQSGRLLMFGGRESSATLSETWEWSRGGWRQLSPSTSPPVRQSHRMVYDSARRRIVLHGGYIVSTSPRTDTWEWTGSTWSLRASTGPSARLNPGMAYDAARGRTVLHGGTLSGTSLTDTWEWDGVTWRRVFPIGTPSPRFASVLAYDAAREQVVLFGGADSDGRRNDTWVYDGSRWTNVTPAQGNPPPRTSHTMTFDPVRQQVLLYGGSGAGPDFATLNDVWAWDGQSWQEVLPTVSGPAGRELSQLIFDESEGQLVLVDPGNSGIDGERMRTWNLRPPRSPAHTFIAQLPSDLELDDGPERIQGLRVRAFCAGRYAPFGPDDTGAELYGWATSSSRPGGSWTPLGQSNAGPTAPVDDWRIEWPANPPASADEAAALLAPGRRLALQCRVAGTSGGSGQAESLADYFEVRVSYRTH